ncbi:MAG TPA: hypothetical protein VMF61_02155 [Candidatus Acidoferrales bacterium]|nr:hypothetical protein [Candidatus Acidoferrales bacterium]
MADCGWARNRGFMVCDYLNSNPGNGVPDNDLAIFSYSPTSKSYARVGVFKGEKPLWERLNVNGNTWTASFNFPYKGATLTYRDVYVYSPDGTRTTTTAQVTADGGHTWTTVSHFAGVKAGP